MARQDSGKSIFHDTPTSGILPQKAIGSLAKNPSDVTRQGTQKLKFVPTLPARRKKEEVQPEAAPQEVSAAVTERSRGRGRGRGDGRGRGRGRGAPRPDLEMTASGPFAMGPALAGSSFRRSVPSSNFSPVPIPGSGPSLGSSIRPSGLATVKSEFESKGKIAVTKAAEDDEVYSEPDEGVEIVDMEHISQMDWMAPQSLRKERYSKKVKKEELVEAPGTGAVDAANALDLSESEEEEEMEDIIENFTARADAEQTTGLREERLYLFQFPSPFPSFVPQGGFPPPPMDGISDRTEVADKQAFPLGVKGEPGSSKTPASQQQTTLPEPTIDGVIGELVVYRSGAVKMKLANGIVLDVNATTQPSFLQQAVYLDATGKRLVVLGEVNKRFSVSPDVDTLLTAMEFKDKIPSMPLDGHHLIQMDMT